MRLGNRLFSPELAIEENLGYASEFFETAKGNRKRIGAALELYALQNPLVDMTMQIVRLYPDIVERAIARIDDGIDGFRTAIIEEVRKVKELGMFPEF